MRTPPLSFEARIMPGAGRGRRIGFPTVNCNLEDIPKTITEGIYAGYVSMNNNQDVEPAAIHYGPRPFFNEGVSFEVYIIDATLEEAPSQLHIELISRLRDVKNFATEEELKTQITMDIKEASDILGKP